MSVAEETYELLEPETAAAYIDSRPELSALVDTGSLDVQEIGDGNLNLVFVCQDAAGRGVVLKQALPYVRLVGPEWPFTPRRAVAEARAYREHGRFAPELIPTLYAFDPERYILAVEDLSDHHVWRTALTDGERHDGGGGQDGPLRRPVGLPHLAVRGRGQGAEAAGRRGRLAGAVRDHRGPRADRAVLRRRPQLVPGRDPRCG